MKSVKQLLDSKGGEVWTVEPGASVFTAIERMAEKEIGALLVVDGGKPVGVISERDYARKVILADRSSRETAVRDIMTSPVLHVGPEQTVEECMALMTEKRIRHLPVLDGGEVVGMLSIGDLVKAIIAEQQFMIAQLERYIAS